MFLGQRSPSPAKLVPEKTGAVNDITGAFDFRNTRVYAIRMSAVLIRDVFYARDYARSQKVMEVMSHLYYLHGATFEEAKDALAFALQTKKGKKPIFKEFFFIVFIVFIISFCCKKFLLDGNHKWSSHSDYIRNSRMS